MNDRDSEIISGLLLERGWRMTEKIEDADCILFNTCSVRHHAEQRAYSNMGTLAKLKRRKPDIVLGFIGCTAQQDKNIVFKRLPHVDLVVGPASIYKLPGLIDDVIKNRKRVLAIDFTERPDRVTPFFYGDRNSAYVSISEGCDNFCSYCIVPYVRGRQRSRKKSNILDEVKAATELGISAITLLGQNVNSYGKDLDTHYDFIRLLEDIHRIEAVKRIRFVTCHPKDTEVELFTTMRSLPKIYKHLHMPLQSGSDRILKAMNRGYSVRHYKHLVEELRRYVPECNLTTDIIVGFPGESDTDFEKTVDLLKRIGFDAAYIFKYSPRPPAKSSEFEDNVEDAVKKDRHRRLLDLQKKISGNKRSSHRHETSKMA
ncbi:MAG: tRNA (N6-isopentenyl adenosine(37)-C2)-methylthiotransferase MiaB [Candidatus Omnitrophica bacterium]|nr:tRNA (N6-isopentenyl adenosine(37)-C2)-methylthiotransferase MiaB [Candidatus Omnitrophota bacterium]